MSGLEALAWAQGGYFDRGDALAHGLLDNLIHHCGASRRFACVFPACTLARYRVPSGPLTAEEWDQEMAVIDRLLEERASAAGRQQL